MGATDLRFTFNDIRYILQSLDIYVSHWNKKQKKPVFFSSTGRRSLFEEVEVSANMPGHIKKSDGPDPDPSPWLIVSPELKVKLKAKPYDPKKSCWVPNKATHGYDEGLIDSTEGDKVTVMILETKEVNATGPFLTLPLGANLIPRGKVVPWE
jgi:hypothetical protein